MTKTCRVPIRVSADYQAAHSSELAQLTRLMMCLLAKGAFAHREGRIADSFEAYRDAYRFAHQIGQGGLAMDHVTHLGCKESCDFGLVIPDLNRAQCTEMLALLDETEATEERAAVVVARQGQWDAAVFPPLERLRHFSLRVAEALRTRSWKPLRSLKSRLQDKLQDIEDHNRPQTAFLRTSLLGRIQSKAAETPAP